jgi:hypothetical protein
MPATAERQISGLLRLKSDIEYGEQSLSEAKARTLVDQAGRFLAWAASVAERPAV